MAKQNPVSVQLRLHLPSESPVPLESTTRKEIVRLLAQLLVSVVDASGASGPEVRDEAR
jgi:hypothetical protein